MSLSGRTGASSSARWDSGDGGGPTVADLAPEVIMTRREVAAWLKVNPRQVERLGIPCIDLGRKTKRYLMKDVLEWIAKQRAD